MSGKLFVIDSQMGDKLKGGRGPRGRQVHNDAIITCGGSHQVSDWGVFTYIHNIRQWMDDIII